MQPNNLFVEEQAGLNKNQTLNNSCKHFNKYIFNHIILNCNVKSIRIYDLILF